MTEKSRKNEVSIPHRIAAFFRIFWLFSFRIFENHGKTDVLQNCTGLLSLVGCLRNNMPCHTRRMAARKERKNCSKFDRIAARGLFSRVWQLLPEPRFFSDFSVISAP